MARRFVNWSKTVATRPAAWHAPAHEDAVVELVRATSGHRVRVIGAGHSWSAIAAPEQHAVTLDNLAGLIALDPEGRRATVHAGTRLHALNAALDAAGFALPIVGSVAQQSIAGLAATGTHGSSLVHGNVATLVDRLRLVDGRGNVVELEGDRLDGASVHLGALGIVTQLRLTIVPAFSLAETVEAIPIADLPTRLGELASSAEYCKVWWLPHTRSAYVFRYDRTEEPETTRPSPTRRRWVDEAILQRWVVPVVLAASRIPAVTPWINRRFAPTFQQPRRVGPSTLMLSTPMPARHRETEAALPMTRASEAVDRIVRMIERERLVVNFILEVRFVRGDAAWMSPASGADTCQIGAYCAGPHATPYFAAFWREMRALGARPHWGKELDHTAEEVRALWPETPKFLALRDELDPERRFGSAFHTAILGA